MAGKARRKEGLDRGPLVDVAEAIHYSSESRIGGPIPRRGEPPLNGIYYTWEDDALNLEMRRTERYVPFRMQPKQDDHGRCRGFSLTKHRPCRKWALRNVEGTSLKFCAAHSNANRGAKNAGIVQAMTHPGRLMTGNAIMAGAETRTKHGVYGAMMRERLVAIMEMKEGAQEREELTTLIGAMDAVDTDDPSDSLDFAIRTTMGMLAQLMERFAQGQVKFGDFMIGVSLCTESLRKLTATKHDVAGSADDENERAIREVLGEMGLGPATVSMPALASMDSDNEDEGDDSDDYDASADANGAVGEYVRGGGERGD